MAVLDEVTVTSGQYPMVQASALQQPLKPLLQDWKKPVPGAQTVGSVFDSVGDAVVIPTMPAKTVKKMEQCMVRMIGWIVDQEGFD